MSKNNESVNYLEKILEVSKEAKTISELAEISGLTKYRIYNVLKENPPQKIIVTENLKKNKEKKKSHLTPEQQEIYDMFMKMAKCRKESGNAAEIISNNRDRYVLPNANRYISLPFKSIADKNTARMKLKNDSYNHNELIKNSIKINMSNDVLLHVGDNIYSIHIFFNNGKNNCLSFRHLRIANLLKKDNAEVVYSTRIYSYDELKNVKRIYQQFIKRFVDTHTISF